MQAGRLGAAPGSEGGCLGGSAADLSLGSRPRLLGSPALALGRALLALLLLLPQLRLLLRLRATPRLRQPPLSESLWTAGRH